MSWIKTLALAICLTISICGNSWATTAVELIRVNGDDTQGCLRSAGADNYALVDEQGNGDGDQNKRQVLF